MKRLRTDRGMMKMTLIVLVATGAAAVGGVVVAQVDAPLVSADAGPDLLVALNANSVAIVEAIDRLTLAVEAADPIVVPAPIVNVEPAVTSITTDAELVPAIKAIAAVLTTHHLHWHRTDPTVEGDCRILLEGE